MFVLLIMTGSKTFSDFVNDILSSLHFDLFNRKPSALDFVTNSSTRDCIELVPFFSINSARVVSSTYFQIFVFAILRPLNIMRSNQGPCKDKLYRSRIQFSRNFLCYMNMFHFDLLGNHHSLARFFGVYIK